MKPAVWFCTAVATALAAAILYWHGISLFSVLVTLIPPACPVWVIWMNLCLLR